MLLLDFGALWILAYLLVGMLKVIPSIGEKAALAFAWALGLKSLIIFALMALGMPQSIWVQAGVSLGALVVAGILRSRKPSNSLSPSWSAEKKSLLFIMMAVILGVLFCFSLANAFFFPITEADGIWYHVRGMVFFS